MKSVTKQVREQESCCDMISLQSTAVSTPIRNILAIKQLSKYLRGNLDQTQGLVRQKQCKLSNPSNNTGGSNDTCISQKAWLLKKTCMCLGITSKACIKPHAQFDIKYHWNIPFSPPSSYDPMLNCQLKVRTVGQGMNHFFMNVLSPLWQPPKQDLLPLQFFGIWVALMIHRLSADGMDGWCLTGLGDGLHAVVCSWLCHASVEQT